MTTKNELNWDDEDKPRLKLPAKLGKITGYGFLGIVVALFIYFVGGMILIHTISDNPDFQAEQVNPGESRAVAIAAALIERETLQNRWTANDPFFMPGYLLDNMPNYQQGIIYALSRFAIEMSDQMGRTRGSSQVDKDLDKAAGLLKYPGNVWIFDLSTSWAPTAPSDSQYKSARKSLIAYNDRLAAGDAIFDRRADNLMATVDRFATDLGSASAIIDQHLAKSKPWFMDREVDDIFYNTKGKLYAYYLLLRELGLDFEKVIRDKDVGNAWAQMLSSLRSSAELDPLIIVNGSPDGLYFPSHLAVQGFYLLRARTQLREIANILQK